MNGKRAVSNGGTTTTVTRLTRLETNYESLRSEVHDTRRAVESIGERLDREFQRLRDSARPQYALWISLATLSVMVMGALGSAAYVPVWITTNNINAKAQTAMDKAGQHETDIATLTTKFKEVETQFRANDEARNVQFAEQQRNNANIQNSLNAIKAPMPTAPSGPFYHPHIGQNHDGDNQ